MTIVLNVTVSQSFNPLTVIIRPGADGAEGRPRALPRRERLAGRLRRRGLQTKTAGSSVATSRPAVQPREGLE